MNKPSVDQTMRHEDAVEALLERAAPRPAPPAEIENEIRSVVHAEWQATTGASRRRRQIGGFAVAATVLLAVAITFTTLNNGGVAPVEVATIAKSHGSIRIESAQSGQVPAVDFSSIATGQTLLTSADSAAGLDWHSGGSLRIDKSSRVEFISDSEIYLHSGRVYFDSESTLPDSEFIIQTVHGAVTHIGTQYLTEATPASLIVSVREGKVEVDGTYYDEQAVAGQVVTITGTSRGAITNTNGTGSDWEWIEVVAPNVDLRGESIHAFLEWVGRETGHEISYDSDAAEQLAHDKAFRGDINSDPRSALRMYIMTVDLEASFDPDEPRIIVSIAR